MRVEMSVYMDGYDPGELTEEDVKYFIREQLGSSGVSVDIRSVMKEEGE